MLVFIRAIDKTLFDSSTGSISSKIFDGTNETSVKIRAKQILPHTLYDPKTLANDIALIELETPVEYRVDIRPVCIPDTEGKSLSRIFTSQGSVYTGLDLLKPLAGGDVIKWVKTEHVV